MKSNKGLTNRTTISTVKDALFKLELPLTGIHHPAILLIAEKMAYSHWLPDQ